MDTPPPFAIISYLVFANILDNSFKELLSISSSEVSGKHIILKENPKIGKNNLSKIKQVLSFFLTTVTFK